MTLESRAVLLLAPLCRDRIVDRDATRDERAGGAAIYASWALVARGARVILHTPLAEGDRDLLDALPPGVEVVLHPSRRTTCFEIEIDPLDPGRRRMRLLDASDPLDPSLLRSPPAAEGVLFGPLWPSDLDEPLAARLRGCRLPLDLGVQGLARSTDEAGRVVPGTAAWAAALLPRIRILGGDAQEIAGCPTTWEAEETVTTLAERGARIRRRGSDEALVIPAAPAKIHLHPVGLGDAFLAVYSWERSGGADPLTAGARAAEAARDLLEGGLAGLAGG